MNAVAHKVDVSVATCIVAVGVSLCGSACSRAPATMDAGLDAIETSPADAITASDAMSADASVVRHPPFLRDDTGGVLILRGTNVSGEAKSTPDFLPAYGSIDFARLRDETGFDVIRLLVFWEAIEPAQSSFDTTYLSHVAMLVSEARAAGLDVIVDMHQDLYGRGFGGDGAPAWSCDAALYAAYTPPSAWYLGYFTPQVETCFDRLWATGTPRTEFTSAWSHLASTLSGMGVLAYEIINEPSWGSTTAHQFDTQIAPDVYTTVADAIRAADPMPWIAVEPAPTASTGLPTALVPPARPNVIYAPHMYPSYLEMGDPYAANDSASTLALVDRLREDAVRLNLPLVVTEMGVRRDVTGAADYLHDAYADYDARMMSVTQWDLSRADGDTYGLWESTGAPALQALAIARPYPRRVAGTPLSWSWDGGTGAFTFVWNEDGTAMGETLVAMPTLALPAGADITIDDGGPTSLDGTILHVPQRSGGGMRHLTLTRH